jgi:hypothetical protein
MLSNNNIFIYNIFIYNIFIYKILFYFYCEILRYVSFLEMTDKTKN